MFTIAVIVVYAIGMLLPPAATDRPSARKWSAVVTACVAALAAVVLFGFRASGDGLYTLPIMGSAVVALCASIAFTLDIRARSRHLDR